VTLDEAREHLEEDVVYERAGDFAGGPDRGVIKAVGTRSVFVCYDGDLSAKATNPADLTLAGAG
jgi:hypothetical protein